MTVSVQTPFSAHTANGLTTVFAYAFKVLAEADLEITLDGVVQTTGFTVSGVGEYAGGSVTFTAAPASGVIVLIARDCVLERETDYAQFGKLPADVLNVDLDRIWLALQEHNNDIGRAIKLPVNTAGDQILDKTPAERANTVVGFDDVGNLETFQVDQNALGILDSPSGSSFVGFVQSGSGAEATTVESKLREIITPKDFGAVGDGTTDDTTAIQEAIDYAETVGGIVDGRNLQYAISSQLTIAGAYPIHFQNFNLIAIAGTWPTGQSGAMIDVSRSTNYAELGSLKISNVVCNANDQAKTGFYLETVGPSTVIENCTTFYFSEKGFWITGNGNTNLKLLNCVSSERLYTTDVNDAFNDYANRTGYAYYIDGSSDVSLIGCVGSGSVTELYMDGAIYNALILGCKFWNGPSQASATSVTVEIVDAHAIQFTGCRFDDGSVLLKSFDNVFTGCRFIQYAFGFITLEATEADETANQLVITGCSFSAANNVVFTTSGVGTWSATLNISFIGNIKDNGASAAIDGWEFLHGNVKYKNNTFSIGDGAGQEWLNIDGGAASTRYARFLTASSPRWAMGAENTAESGSQAGSNFFVNSYNDAGTYLATPFSIERATGKVSFSNAVVASPGATAPTLSLNGQVTFELTNNTTLTFKARGSDGNTRSGTVTLSL
jgi:hypothetical protein